jgi:hypothetical protein
MYIVQVVFFRFTYILRVNIYGDWIDCEIHCLGHRSAATRPIRRIVRTHNLYSTIAITIGPVSNSFDLDCCPNAKAIDLHYLLLLQCAAIYLDQGLGDTRYLRKGMIKAPLRQVRW